MICNNRLFASLSHVKISLKKRHPRVEKNNKAVNSDGLIILTIKFRLNYSTNNLVTECPSPVSRISM
jgi:hypothetical protein